MCIRDRQDRALPGVSLRGMHADHASPVLKPLLAPAMPLVTTDALVLHAFDYRETSRIVRLVTRELGVVSVIARGARRPKNKFGAALDLFDSGDVQLTTTPGRDLHALMSFEATRSPPALAGSHDSFAGAAALAE